MKIQWLPCMPSIIIAACSYSPLVPDSYIIACISQPSTLHGHGYIHVWCAACSYVYVPVHKAS